jgi:predicted ATP-binding protein involved in virulence
MRLAYIKISGFRGVKGHLTINFPLGFAVIHGPNGVGKTTICNAIEFALTGNLDRNIEATEKGESFSDYTWWRGESPPKERYVSLGIQDESSAVFEITRTPKGLERATDHAIQA